MPAPRHTGLASLGDTCQGFLAAVRTLRSGTRARIPGRGAFRDEGRITQELAMRLATPLCTAAGCRDAPAGGVLDWIDCKQTWKRLYSERFSPGS